MTSTTAVSDQLADLYVDLAGHLRQIVRRSVRAPDAVIEDACQVAWSRLVQHWNDVRPESALGWLVTTASREALKLMRRRERELPLEALAELRAPWTGFSPAPEHVVELRWRLEELAELSVRQQRLVWLQGLGFSYAEMSGHTGASVRTVERDLLRARRFLRSG